MAYESQTTRNSNDALIPNTGLEAMFLRVCTDEEMSKYTELVESGHISLATAYAQNKMNRVFYPMVEKIESVFGTIEEFMQTEKRKGVK